MMEVMRATILGFPGSGKSTLAQKISEKQHIPHIHIDRFWLEAGGGQNSRSTPNAEQIHADIRTKVLEAIQADAWVSDGVYSRVQPEILKRADTIIYLDLSLWRRLLNHATRILKRSGRHAEVTIWSDLQFFIEMISRDLTKKSKIQNLLAPYADDTITLRSRGEINKYLQSLE